MGNKSTDFVKIIGECDIEDIDLSQGNFTQVAVPETLEIPEQKPDVEQVLKVMLEGKVTSVRLVATPEGESASGIKKTGKGLVVEGKLHQKVVYVAETDEGDQPVHSAEFNIPFSTFIPINTCLLPGSEDQIDVEVCIEDVYVEMLDQRTIFKNVTILVNAIVPENEPEITILEPVFLDPANPPEFSVGTEIPIKVEASDCECIDRVELVVLNPADNLVFEESVVANGKTELLTDFNWDTTGRAPNDFTVIATVYDCADPANETNDTITIALV
ncbi:DUF3794 domain-containing protein [Halanaerobacter jeridensis]|uniref:SipL SPOCS domain-containing protein n=1 Tax=Halanaerobacter jeridensis TaxID=706427 RepID=A0A938XSE5_9FIRM|nr:DUF3794 domain-containing protein [Halanaerobacter jeridensis]MBM7556623.1 hypothetical protein [Halanaerobacter jeridensis]